MGKILYPGAFADIEPAQKADEIYRSYLGRPVYDQMAAAFTGFGLLTLSDQLERIKRKMCGFSNEILFKQRQQLRELPQEIELPA